VQNSCRNRTCKIPKTLLAVPPSKMQSIPLSIKIGKSLLQPPTYEGWNTSPPNLWKWIFYPMNFLKQDKSPPEAVLKNHSKSPKNHKMKNQIVLDFKLVLRSEHIIWNALVHIFCCNFRSMLFSIIVKKVLNIPYYMFIV
jgi:hypothetical protein